MIFFTKTTLQFTISMLVICVMVAGFEGVTGVNLLALLP